MPQPAVKAIGRRAQSLPVDGAASAKSAPAARPKPRSCLIVDDSRVMRRVSRQVVESLGLTVAEAEDGKEALARCGAAMPDLILLDWNMPVMTGIEFITELRAQPGGDRPMVVFCTTENDPAIIGKGVAAGADGFVTKPFDPATLQSKLQRLGAA